MHQRNKLQAKSKLIYIGVPKGIKGYLLIDPQTKKTHVARDVVFEAVVNDAGSGENNGDGANLEREDRK